MYDIDSIVLLCILFLLCFLMSSCSTYATLLNSVRFTDLIRFRFFFFSSLWPKPGRMPYYLIRKFNNNVRTSCNRMANYLNDSPLSLSQFRPSFYHITMPFYLFPPPKTAKTKRIWPCFPTNDMYDVSNISIFYHIIHYIYISIVCVRMYAGRGHSDKM